MERVEHAREDLVFAVDYVIDLWTAVPALARLELRSMTESLSALVPALDSLARATEAFNLAMRDFDAAVRLNGYRAGGA